MVDESVVFAEIAEAKGLVIINKYDSAFNYLYPILLNISHKHRVIRDCAIKAITEQYRLFYTAAKSGQLSRIYEADAGLAYIKELLRQLANPVRKLISRRQYETASVRLSEVGALIGGWIRQKQKR